MGIEFEEEPGMTGDPEIREEEQAAEETAQEAAPESTGEETAAADEAQETPEAPEGSGDGEKPEEAGEKEGRKGLFGRSRKADKEKQQLLDRVAELEEKTIRQMAEFDNFRKRTDREKEAMFSSGERSVIEKILPVVDNFERGFDSVEKADENDAFVEGMRKIYAQLVKQLEDLGVTPIEAVGKEFDPQFHNAVMQVESEELESGTVAMELQKGYKFHDTVIRHSMVSVVK